ncbi:tyrosine-type recombinase/integrase [Cytobacillus sp. Bac17]|uniref:tyrosine-type recombinase/integrase n=1 Tax=Cytobacillus sp. Bac17 TaxID=2926008 RepID=UPI0021184D20|nr:tyrosine-type recombinase/integrase [Cytobacillus sp. Bac17]
MKVANNDTNNLLKRRKLDKLSEQKNKYWLSTHCGIPETSKQILNEFLLTLRVENKAIATITKYRRILEKFLSECRTPLGKLTSIDVKKWLDVFSAGKKPKTVDLVLAALSKFFNFCLEEEYMETTVIKKRWKPKIPQSLRKYLDEYEYVHVKRTAEYLPIRDRALVLFLFSSGCRVSEASNLNLQDVNIEKRTAVVKGKGNKLRHIHFTEECALVLIEYLQTRSSDPTEPF